MTLRPDPSDVGPLPPIGAELDQPYPTEPYPTEHYAPEPPPEVGNGRGPRDLEPAELVPPDQEYPVLPEELWAARPELGHVRTAARARLISPDALLGSVLARVCLFADHRLVLPAVVGRVGSLNLAVGLAGRSGAGKGSVADESRDLVGHAALATDHRVTEAPAGSGEGIVRLYFELVADPEDGRRRSLQRVRDAVLVRVDEGETLRALGNRQGQTTWQTLRQAFSGEVLGGSYVDDSRRSRLEAHSYRLALLVAIQPELAAFIFDDVVGGTPQRFVWFSTLDPHAPKIDALPEHPGPLRWRPPIFHDQHVQARVAAAHGTTSRAELGVEPAIVEAIRGRQHDVLMGADLDPLDAHAELLRLKVAALLAVLQTRIDVTVDDWDLAGLVMTTSRKVRASMRAAIEREGAARHYAANERAAERAARVENAKAAAGVSVGRVAAVIARHVAKHAAEEDGCIRQCLTRSVRSTDRDQFEAALGHALSMGWVTEADGYRPGESRPA